MGLLRAVSGLGNSERDFRVPQSWKNVSRTMPGTAACPSRRPRKSPPWRWEVERRAFPGATQKRLPHHYSRSARLSHLLCSSEKAPLLRPPDKANQEQENDGAECGGNNVAAGRS